MPSNYTKRIPTRWFHERPKCGIQTHGLNIDGIWLCSWILDFPCTSRAWGIRNYVKKFVASNISQMDKISVLKPNEFCPFFVTFGHWDFPRTTNSQLEHFLTWHNLMVIQHGHYGIPTTTQMVVCSRYSSHDHDKVFFNSILLEGLFVLLLFHVANTFFSHCKLFN
jgi:hypothetical protein